MALFAGWSPAVIVTDGENFVMSENDETFALVSRSALMTDMEIGNVLNVLDALFRGDDDGFDFLGKHGTTIGEGRGSDSRQQNRLQPS